MRMCGVFWFFVLGTFYLLTVIKFYVLCFIMFFFTFYFVFHFFPYVFALHHPPPFTHFVLKFMVGERFIGRPTTTTLQGCHSTFELIWESGFSLWQKKSIYFFHKIFFLLLHNRLFLSGGIVEYFVV